MSYQKQNILSCVSGEALIIPQGGRVFTAVALTTTQFKTRLQAGSNALQELQIPCGLGWQASGAKPSRAEPAHVYGKAPHGRPSGPSHKKLAPSARCPFQVQATVFKVLFVFLYQIWPYLKHRESKQHWDKSLQSCFHVKKWPECLNGAVIHAHNTVGVF